MNKGEIEEAQKRNTKRMKRKINKVWKNEEKYRDNYNIETKIELERRKGSTEQKKMKRRIIG